MLRNNNLQHSTTFFPNKLEKHEKCCTQRNTMLNLNIVKCNASKLEALVDYPKRKKVTEEKGDTDDQHQGKEENYKCRCNLDDQGDAKSDTAMNPLIDDFISIIEVKFCRIRI